MLRRESLILSHEIQVEAAPIWRARFLSPRVLSPVLTLLATACGGTPSSLPSAPTAADPTVVVTGRVADNDGAPVTAAKVCAFPAVAWPMAWARSSSLCGVSDAAGTFRLQPPQYPDLTYAMVVKDGHFQQCAVAVTLATDTNVDVTSTADVVAAALPAAPDRRQVSGVAYERTGSGRRPLPGRTSDEK